MRRRARRSPQPRLQFDHSRAPLSIRSLRTPLATLGERNLAEIDRDDAGLGKRLGTVSGLASGPSPNNSPSAKGRPPLRPDQASGGPDAAQERKPPMIPRSRQFIAILVGLLALNLVISFVTRGPADRERVPYQPFFVEQVDSRNVLKISSKEDAIEGELKREATYDPPGDAKPVKVTKFKTQVPTFIDPAALTKLLDRRNVVINAEAPDTGR